MTLPRDRFGAGTKTKADRLRYVQVIELAVNVRVISSGRVTLRQSEAMTAGDAINQGLSTKPRHQAGQQNHDSDL